MAKYLLIMCLGACLSVALTPVAKWLALYTGALDMPEERRIHRQPTPRFGGLAIFASAVLGLLAAMFADPFIAGALLPRSRGGFVAIASTFAIVTIGTIDDRFALGPVLKLALEIAVAALVALYGYRVESVAGVNLGWLAVPATVVWLVAVTNAFNMIDGLDGLAAGVAGIVTTTLFLLSLYLENVGAGLVLASLGGALIGFLPYNFHPARIFLGDSGSLSLGFALGLTSVVTSNKLATVVAVLVPILALGLPLAELALTTLRRALRALQVVLIVQGPEQRRYGFQTLGRPALFTADRDHIHHRLLSLGITHKSAVLILYAGCGSLCAGALGLVALRAPGQAFLILAVGLVSLVAINRLGYTELHPLRNGLLLPLFDSGFFSKRFAQALLDLGFIVSACVGAYLIEHQGALTPGVRSELCELLPLVAVVQMACFAALRLYRRAYRHVRTADLLTILKALAVAVVLSWGAVLITGEWRGGHFPGLRVAVLDAYLLGTLVLGARLSYRVLVYVFAREQPRESRMLIYGTGGASDLAFARIKSDRSLKMSVVGFLDDDRDGDNGTVQGVPIYCPRDLKRLIAAKKLDGLILSDGEQRSGKLQKVLRRCAAAGLVVRPLELDTSGATADSHRERKSLRTLRF